MEKRSKSVLQHFREMEEEGREGYLEKVEEIEKKSKEMDEEIDRLQKETLKKDKQSKKDDEAYLKMIGDLEKEIEKEIRKNQEIQLKVIRGEKSLGDLQGIKHPSEIRRVMKSEWREKNKPVVETGKANKLIHLKVWSDLQKITFKQRSMENNSVLGFKRFLEEILRRIGEVSLGSMHVEGIRSEQQKIEWAIRTAERGGSPQPSTHEVDSIEELELLVLDPRIQIRHLPDLDEKINELREKVFPWDDFRIVIHYRSVPSDESGFSGFVFNEVPKSPGVGKFFSTNDPPKRKKSMELGDLE